MKPESQFTRARIRELEEKLNRMEKGHDPQDVYLDNADLLQRFRISRRTSYNWRKQGLLKFVMTRRKVFYRLSDIREFLEKCRQV